MKREEGRRKAASVRQVDPGPSPERDFLTLLILPLCVCVCETWIMSVNLHIALYFAVYSHVNKTKWTI